MLISPTTVPPACATIAFAEASCCVMACAVAAVMSELPPALFLGPVVQYMYRGCCWAAVGQGGCAAEGGGMSWGMVDAFCGRGEVVARREKRVRVRKWGRRII